MNFRFFVLAASLFTIAGCADTPQLPAAPDEVRLSANPASDGVVQSINGTADIDTPDGFRRMQIHARKSADGTVSGSFRISQQWGNDLVLDADVKCFTIVDNRAYVGAVLTAVNGVPFNSYFSLRLVMTDNGEGNNAAPDQSSQFVSGGANMLFQPQAFCDNANLVLPMYDLVRGNLQIRP